MPAIAAIVLADGQATPVNKTFTPADCTSALSLWTERSSGIPIGQPKATMSLLEGPNSNKLTLRLLLPKLETASTDGVAGFVAAPKVAYSLLGKVEIVLPHRASLQDRKDILAFTKNFLGNATFATKAVEEFERPY